MKHISNTFVFKDNLIIKKKPPEFVCSNQDFIRDRDALMRNLHRFRRWCKSTAQLLTLKRESQVLEVGCGLGFGLREFANIGCKCVGLEISRGRAKTAKMLALYFGLDLEIVVGTACNLPFKDCSFEAVYSNEFFSHVTNILVALNEQQRVLQVGKKLLIRDGNLLCPSALFELLIRYPIRTKGKYGGLKWLVNRNKNIKNCYGHTESLKRTKTSTLYYGGKKG